MYLLIFFSVLLLVEFVLNKFGVLIMRIFCLKMFVFLLVYLDVIEVLKGVDMKVFLLSIVLLVEFFLFLVFLRRIIFILFFRWFDFIVKR